MSLVAVYSVLFGITGIVVGLITMWQLWSRVSMRGCLATYIAWFAYHVLFMIFHPIPSPFVDYLVVEWMFIPEILLAMTFRKKMLLPMFLFSTSLLLLAITFPEITIFGSGMIMVVPVVIAMLSVYKHPVLGIIYGIIAAIVMYLNLCWSGAEYPTQGAIGFLVFWVLFAFLVWSVLYSTLEKERPAEMPKRHGLIHELQRKTVHVMLFGFYIAVIYGMEIVTLIHAAYRGVMGGLPELEAIIASGPEEVGLMLLRYAFAMLMFPFFITDFLRMRFTERYTPAVGFSMKLSRKKEKTRFMGSTDILIGGALGLLFMNLMEAMVTIMVLVTADIASAMVGTAIGKHKLYRGKTIEGTIAGVIVGILCAWAISGNIWLSLAAGLTFIGADILSDIIPASDNLIAPVAMALVFWLI